MSTPNTSQSTKKIEEQVNFWLSQLQVRTVQNHPPVKITAEDQANLEKAATGILTILKETCEAALPNKHQLIDVTDDNEREATAMNNLYLMHNQAIDQTKANLKSILGGSKS